MVVNIECEVSLTPDSKTLLHGLAGPQHDLRRERIVQAMGAPSKPSGNN